MPIKINYEVRSSLSIFRFLNVNISLRKYLSPAESIKELRNFSSLTSNVVKVFIFPPRQFMILKRLSLVNLLKLQLSFCINRKKKLFIYKKRKGLISIFNKLRSV